MALYLFMEQRDVQKKEVKKNKKLEIKNMDSSTSSNHSNSRLREIDIVSPLEIEHSSSLNNRWRSPCKSPSKSPEYSVGHNFVFFCSRSF